MTGSYFSGTSPTIQIRLLGSVLGADRQVSAVLDTGFVGFLLLPANIGVGLGYMPHATMDIMLADGSRHVRSVCLASVEFGGRIVRGAVILEEHGAEALVGMEFLQSFRLRVTLDAVAFTLTLQSNAP